MAIQAGTLPLEIIRGTQFAGAILQCRDENLAVTGTLVPDVTGTYVLSGTFNGFPLFILADHPATFCYYSTAATSYIIARTLSTTGSGITDYWVPSSPLTEPTGTYQPVGTYTGVATGDDNPVNLTGFTAESTVRRTENPQAELYIDLAPTITDFTGGEITIPAMTHTQTGALEFTGNFKWDLVLVSSGERFGPFVKGPFVVADNITQG